MPSIRATSSSALIGLVVPPLSGSSAGSSEPWPSSSGMWISEVSPGSPVCPVTTTGAPICLPSLKIGMSCSSKPTSSGSDASLRGSLPSTEARPLPLVCPPWKASQPGTLVLFQPTPVVGSGVSPLGRGLSFAATLLPCRRVLSCDHGVDLLDRRTGPRLQRRAEVAVRVELRLACRLDQAHRRQALDRRAEHGGDKRLQGDGLGRAARRRGELLERVERSLDERVEAERGEVSRRAAPELLQRAPRVDRLGGEDALRAAGSRAERDRALEVARERKHACLAGCRLGADRSQAVEELGAEGVVEAEMDRGREDRPVPGVEGEDVAHHVALDRVEVGVVAERAVDLLADQPLVLGPALAGQELASGAREGARIGRHLPVGGLELGAVADEVADQPSAEALLGDLARERRERTRRLLKALPGLARGAAQEALGRG